MNFQRLLYEAQSCECDIPKKLKPLVDEIMKATANEFSPAIANKINQIWATKIIHSIYDEHWQKWQIVENSDYFFDHVLRIASEGYLPNSQDVLRAKPPSTPDKPVSYKDKIFKVWLPKGAKIEFSYNPDEKLGEILTQVRQQKDIPEEPPYVVWDSHGIILTEFNQIPLGQLETLEIYYFPEGMKPLHLLPAPNKKLRRLSGNPNLQKDPRRINGILSSKDRTHSTKNVSQKIDKRSGLLSLNIQEANNIANDHDSIEYVYVVVNDGIGEKRYRTIPVTNAVNTKIAWNQSFKFNVPTTYI
jgi:hypothetical protein